MNPLQRLLSSTARICFAPDDAGGSGGGDNAGGDNNRQQGNNNQGSNKDRRENNSGDFSLEDGNIWEQPRDNTRQRNDDRVRSADDANNRNQQPDVLANFEAFVGKKTFGEFKLSKEDIDKFVQAGDTAGLSSALLKSQQAMYKEVMLDASRMVNSAVERAVEAAVNKATGNFETSNAKSTLQRIVPLAKNPNIAPVAEAVMSTFLKKGQDHETAAGNVGKFLNALRNVKGKDIGVDDPPPNNRNNRGSRAASNEDDDLVDWLEFVKS